MYQSAELEVAHTAYSLAYSLVSGTYVLDIGRQYSPVSVLLQGPYCASKAALNLISESLRRELNCFGIAVITLRIGPWWMACCMIVNFLFYLPGKVFACI